MSPIKVALAGATGNLGGPILKGLLAAEYHVSVLSRIGGNSSKLVPHPNLSIKEVDFTSLESIVPALHGCQIVVSCFSTSAMGSQNTLIDAAVAAGVTRFIPAEFGMDSANPITQKLPVCAMKVSTQLHLLQHSVAHPGFTYTCIANGLFLDWGIQEGFIINPHQHKATLYNGGDVLFSATTLADIAQAVLGVITHRRETANRIIYIQSALVTQNQLIGYAKEKDGKAWDTEVKATEEVKNESFAELAKGEDGSLDAAYLGFSVVGCLDEKYGGNFEGRLDNEIVGVKGLGVDEVRALVQKFV